MWNLARWQRDICSFFFSALAPGLPDFLLFDVKYHDVMAVGCSLGEDGPGSRREVGNMFIGASGFPAVGTSTICFKSVLPLPAVSECL